MAEQKAVINFTNDILVRRIYHQGKTPVKDGLSILARIVYSYGEVL